jgi:hypothetical protein
VLPLAALKAFSADEITELVCGRDTLDWTLVGRCRLNQVDT